MRAHEPHVRNATANKPDDEERGYIVVGKALGWEARASLALLVVDEAHHVHAAGELEPIVDKFAPVTSSTHLLLLSDVSQSGEIEMSQVRNGSKIIEGSAEEVSDEAKK